jgi:mRNA interferase RelE/StbE
MVSLLFTKVADKALRQMPRDVAQRIRHRLDGIAANPYADHPGVTKLQNRPGYRLRVRNGRVICEIEGDRLIILVLKIGLRGEVYR